MATRRILFKELVPGQQYHLQVRARGDGNAFLNSNWSDIFSFTPVASGTIPSAPTGVTATPIGTEYYFTWTAPTTNTDASTLNDLKDYEVTIFDTATPSGAVVFYTQDTQVVMTFEENDAYFGGVDDVTIEVKARNSRNVLSALGTDNGINTAPGAFTVTANDYRPGAMLTWGVPSGGDIDYYEIHRAGSLYATTKSLYFIDTQDAGTSVAYFVRAFDVFGNSTDSNTVNVTIETLDDRYVDETGDTMTGDLIMSGGNIQMGAGDVFLADDGTEALPAYSFLSDPNTGIYSVGADNMGLVAGGSAQAEVRNGVMYTHDIIANEATDFTNVFRGIHILPDTATGASGNRIETWGSSADGRLVRMSTASGLSTSAVKVGISDIEFEFGSPLVAQTKVTSTGELLVGSGSVSTPSLSFISDPDTGFYRIAGGQIGVSLNGSLDFTFNATNSTLTFGSTSDVNLYRSAANTLATDDDFHIVGKDLILDDDTHIKMGAADEVMTYTGGNIVIGRNIGTIRPQVRLGNSSMTVWDEAESKNAFIVNESGSIILDPTTHISAGTSLIKNVVDPVDAQDAATKNYVDALKQGLDFKDSVRVATTADINLSAAPASIDGVTLTSGDRVLVKDQATGTQNGIYDYNGSGSAMTRSDDADQDGEMSGGTYVFVEEGTAHSDSGWVITNEGDIVIDTDAPTWTQFSGAGQITAGAGLTKTGNTIDAVGTADRITVNADDIDIASTYVGQTSITTLGTVTTGTWQAGNVTVPVGTAAAPSINFSGDTDTGIYHSTTGTVKFAANGTQVGFFDGSGLTLVGGGAANNAIISIANDTDTGLYGVAGRVSVTAAGANVVDFTADTTTFSPTNKVRINNDGDVSLASTTHGLQIGSTSLANIAIDGNEIMARNNGAAGVLYLNLEGGSIQWGGTNSQMLAAIDGAATIPAYSFANDSNTGIYRVAENVLGFAAASTLIGQIDFDGFKVKSGTAALPSLSFISDGNTGFYNENPDEISMTTGGTKRWFITSTGSLRNVNDSVLSLYGSASTTDVLLSRINGDTNSRFTIDADGQLGWGDGTAAHDVTLYRGAANVLTTQDNLQVDGVVYSITNGSHIDTWDGGASPTGAIVIHTGVTFSSIWLTNCTIELYEYSSNVLTTYKPAGYAFSGDYLVNHGYTKFGPNDANLRFGRDPATDKLLIIIGETADTWAYPEIRITQAGVTSSPTYLYSWTTGVETDLSSYTVWATNRHEAWTNTNDGAGSGLDADLLDGLDSLQFLRSDADDSTTGKLGIGGAEDGSWRTTVHTGASGTGGLVIKQAAGQTAEPFRIQNDAGAELFQITDAGTLRMQVSTWHADVNGDGRLYFGSSGTSYYKSGQPTGFIHQFRNSNDVDVITIDAGDKILFGSAEDTNLYRSAANTLKTDDDFVVGTSMTVTSTTTDIHGWDIDATSLKSANDTTHPLLVLKSTAVGDNWIDQGAEIRLGEGANSEASDTHLKLTYRGDGSGYIGMGSSTNGIPSNSYIRFFWNDNDILMSASQFRAVNSGTAALPMYTWNGDNDTGMFLVSSANIGFSISGTERLRINGNGQLLGVDGSAAAPEYSFLSDPNTGMYRGGTDSLVFSTNAVGRLTINTSDIIVDTNNLLTSATPTQYFANRSGFELFKDDAGTYRGGRKILNTGTFAGIADQVAYIDFGNIDYLGDMEITVYGGWSSGKAMGKIVKRFSFYHDLNATSFGHYESEIPTAFGEVYDNYAIGELEIHNVDNFRLPIYKINSTHTTALEIVIEGFAVGTTNADVKLLLESATIVAPATVANSQAVEPPTFQINPYVGTDRILTEADLTNLDDADTLDGLDSTQFLRSDTSDTMIGDLTVGETSGPSRFITVLASDANEAGLQAYGSGQGTGFVFVGQSANYGGGLFYNGDGTPSFATGETADSISFFRRNNGVDEVVFATSYSNNNVSFRGSVRGVDGSAATPAFNFVSDGNTGMYLGAADDLRFATGGVDRLRLTDTVITYNGNTVWHAGNDGAGSGLDADTVDGIEGANFARSDVDDTIAGTFIFSKNATGVAPINTRNGNTSAAIVKQQILLGYSGTDNYRHAIQTRHAAGSVANNAIDVLLWQDPQAVGDLPNNHVLTIDGTGIGIFTGTTPPAAALEVNGGIKSSSLEVVGTVTTTSTLTANGRVTIDRGEPGVSPYSGSSLVIQDDVSHYINMLAPDASETGILFGEATGGALEAGIIYGNASNEGGLQFRAGGNVTQMVVDSSGNVGMGTTAPVHELHIYGGTNADARMRIESNGAYSAVIELLGGGATHDAYIFSSGGGGGATQGDLYLFSDANDTVLGVSEGNVQKGNVGIGTRSPTVKLDVVGAGAFTSTVTVAEPTASSHAATKNYVDSKRYAATIGDGVATTYTVTHNLNTRDVWVAVYEAASPYEQVLPTIKYTTVNAVDISFAEAPATNEFRVVVIA